MGKTPGEIVEEIYKEIETVIEERKKKGRGTTRLLP
jgi:hypothetical protein